MLHRLILDPRLTPQALGRIEDALAQLRDGDVLALSGSSSGFCEGMDLEWLGADLAGVEGFLDRYAAVLRSLALAPGPVIALVDGAAAGGGLALAATADIVLATERASFALPEVFVGLIPAVALPPVARRIGHGRVRALALGARPLTAAQALACGLCDEVVGDLEAALVRYERRFRRASPAALAASKHLLHTLGTPGYAAGARALQSALIAGEDTRERMERSVAGEAPWGDEG